MRYRGRGEDHGGHPSGAATDAQGAWLTLDDTDAAAGRLITYLEAALGAQVESARGLATRALAARLPHTEAAGLLAEAVGQTPVLLVIDEVERIAHAPEALAVLASFVRYAPPELRVVMISRVEVPIALDSTAALGGAVTISESDLVFRTDEAAQALALAGRADMDPDDAVEVTGGWVAGVLFEAWRSNQHVMGMGGEADALHGYLSSQILDQLSAADREFLITTSVLDDVTPARAGGSGGERRCGPAGVVAHPAPPGLLGQRRAFGALPPASAGIPARAVGAPRHGPARTGPGGAR